MEGKTKSITFDKAAQDALPQDIKDKMKANRENVYQKSIFRGHEIYHDGKEWRYCDNNEKTVENWKNRACGACGKENTPEGHDGCLGTLPGVINACCGHGRIGTAYVEFEDHEIIRGKEAFQRIKELKGRTQMSPEELIWLKNLLKRFINGYQHKYPISAENAHFLRSTVTEIMQS